MSVHVRSFLLVEGCVSVCLSVFALCHIYPGIEAKESHVLGSALPLSHYFHPRSFSQQHTGYYSFIIDLELLT